MKRVKSALLGGSEGLEGWGGLTISPDGGTVLTPIKGDIYPDQEEGD